jgi:hypothetical protein
MTVSAVLNAAGRRRSPATLPGYHVGRPLRNKGRLYPADPATVEEIVAVRVSVGAVKDLVGERQDVAGGVSRGARVRRGIGGGVLDHGERPSEPLPRCPPPAHATTAPTGATTSASDTTFTAIRLIRSLLDPGTGLSYQLKAAVGSSPGRW